MDLDVITGLGSILYDILDLDLKNLDDLTRLGLIWFNEAGMLLQTHGDFVESSVKQLMDYLSVQPHYCAFYAALGIACHCHKNQ